MNGDGAESYQKERARLGTPNLNMLSPIKFSPRKLGGKFGEKFGENFASFSPQAIVGIFEPAEPNF